MFAARKIFGAVAQLVRAQDSYPSADGREFKACQAFKIFGAVAQLVRAQDS